MDCNHEHVQKKGFEFSADMVMVLKDENRAEFPTCIVSPSDRACWKALLCSLVVASYRIQSFCLCDVWCHRCVLMTTYEDHVIGGLWLMGVDYVDLDLKVSEKASTNLAQESLSQASLVVE